LVAGVGVTDLGALAVVGLGEVSVSGFGAVRSPEKK
jgi:hypothetical protein